MGICHGSTRQFRPSKVQFWRLCVSLAGLGLLLPAGFAQRGYAQEINAPDQTASSKPETEVYSVAGTVVNSVTGEPIRRAAVQIFGSADRATLTDNSGHFEFGGLAEGRASVGANKPGFFPDQRENQGQISLQVGPNATPLVVKLIPASVIAGRVTDRDERPLEGFTVHVVTKQNANGRPTWFDHLFQAQTNENGEFRLPTLPPGTYYVEVDESQETTLARPGVPNAREHGYAKVFYPGVSEFSAATALDLRAGQQLEANFTLTPEPFYQVSGVASSKETLNSALTFSRKAGEVYDFTLMTPAPEGKFQIRVPAGSYSVSGFAGNGVHMSTPGASLVIASDSPDVHLSLAPAISIPVTMRTETASGTPQTLSQVQALSGITLQFFSNSSFRRSTNWWRPPMPEIQNLEPGTYSVEAFTAGQYWVKSVRSGSVDLLADDLTVTAGAQPAAIEITLRDDAASIIGTVAHSEPLQPPTVLLVQPGGQRNLIKAVPAIEGKFEFDGVPPGEYWLLAFDRVDQLEYSDPEVLTPYLSGAIHVSVQPHGTASVNLNLSPIGK